MLINANEFAEGYFSPHVSSLLLAIRSSSINDILQL
jgi:hypothetical protein